MNDMEYSAEETEILEQRARELSRSIEKEDKGEVVARLAVISVGNEQFGIPVHSLVEVVRMPSITRLPELPEWITGIVQIRGKLISVVDLAHWFRIPSLEESDFLAILSGPPGMLGLRIGGVVDFREVFSDEIVQTIQGAELSAGRPIAATTRDLLTILDSDRLFNNRQIIIGVRDWDAT